MALAGVRAAKKAAEARRRAGGNWGNVQRLKIKPDASVTIRVLDYDFAYVHAVEKTLQGGKKIWTSEVCVDSKSENPTAACPGCEKRAEVADPKNDRHWRRSFQFSANVIQRNGPILERETDEKGNVKLKKDSNGDFIETGKGDVLCLWQGGIRAADELDDFDDDYGLYTRDILVKRDGDGLDTKYRVKPARDEDGNNIPPRDLNASETELAKGKHDLAPLTTPVDYGVWVDNALGTNQGTGTVSTDSSGAAPEGSPFNRRRIRAQQDDD